MLKWLNAISLQQLIYIYIYIYTNLNDQQQFRLNRTNEFKDYLVPEIKERDLMSKRLSKYIASFDYFDKSLIVLSAANHIISMASFSTVIGAPVEIVNAIFSVAFSVSTGIVKKLLKEHEIKKKNVIKLLC